MNDFWLGYVIVLLITITLIAAVVGMALAAIYISPFCLLILGPILLPFVGAPAFSDIGENFREWKAKNIS